MGGIMKYLMKLMKQKLSLVKTEYKRQKLLKKKGHISAQQLKNSETGDRGRC